MNTFKLENEVKLAIKSSVKLLATSQQSNGQFVGLASQDPEVFSDSNVHQTTFFTSLIVSSLEIIPDSDDIKAKAAEFILKERSPFWSWNYWLRDSVDFQRRPYPDDLDDTACALTALAVADKAQLTQECLANFGRNLISQESKPGGPYKTWLVAPTAKSVWKDIDLAVNSNVANFLRYQDIRLDGIEEYATEKIMSDSLISKYYLGEIPVIYFLSRWYQGPAIERLQYKVESLLVKISLLNDLNLSMLLTAAMNLKYSKGVESIILVLLKRQTNDGWAANALYYEPAIENTKYFAGSTELTTAIACEALQKFLDMRTPKQKVNITSPNNIVRSTSPPNAHNLETRYQNYLQAIKRRDAKGQITKIAALTGQSLDTELDKDLIANLNLASLNGWASYTLFDDFFDDGGEADRLPMAMLALRRAGSYFRKALPNDQGFANHVETVLDIVDNANDWELTFCRLPTVSNRIELSDLPDFTDLSQLAHKSWGHTIASTGVLIASGYPLSSQSQSSIRKFYYHYLIARQLNDDAHDWQTDVVGRQLSYVVTELIKGYAKNLSVRSIQPAKDIAALQTYFWEYTISEVIFLINKHLILARKAIADCPAVTNKSIFLAWLEDIQAATDKAARARNEASSFIKTFTAK